MMSRRFGGYMSSFLLVYMTVSLVEYSRLQSSGQSVPCLSQHLCFNHFPLQPKASLASMHLTSAIILLAPLLSFSLAAPQAASSTTAVSSPVPTSSEYYLKSQVIHNRHSSKDDLYLEAYHTGAGFNDGTFASSTQGAAKAFLNETYQQFDLGTAFPWGIYIGGDTNYAGMAFGSL